MQPHKTMEFPAESLQKGRAPIDFINCATSGTGENAKQPHKSMELLAEALQKGLVANSIAYYTAISACRRTHSLWAWSSLLRCSRKG